MFRTRFFHSILLELKINFFNATYQRERGKQQKKKLRLQLFHNDSWIIIRNLIVKWFKCCTYFAFGNINTNTRGRLYWCNEKHGNRQQPMFYFIYIYLYETEILILARVCSTVAKIDLMGYGECIYFELHSTCVSFINCSLTFQNHLQLLWYKSVQWIFLKSNFHTF